MSKHESHVVIVKRLKRAQGHLKSVIEMIEQERPCPEIAQQLQAVESAIANAKQILVLDHIDHCLEHAAAEEPQKMKDMVEEFKAIARYL